MSRHDNRSRPWATTARFRGYGRLEGDSIAGRSYPDAGVPLVQPGRRHRRQPINRAADDHRVHHTFERVSAGSRHARATPPVTGNAKDVVLVEAMTHTGPPCCTDTRQGMDNCVMTLLRHA
jgi:hypothetical protein